MRIGFSHYKPEKTPSSSTVVLPPFPSSATVYVASPPPPSLGRLLPIPRASPSSCSFSIFTSRSRFLPSSHNSLFYPPSLPTRGRMATCQLQLAIAAAYLDRGMEEKQKKKKKEKKKVEEEWDRRVGSTGAAQRGTSRNPERRNFVPRERRRL